MKFNFKFFTFNKLYIHFFFFALINIFFSTDNIHAKTFSIDDIEISSPFEINFDKNKIIDEGFKKAFNELILSITQTKDQKKLNNTSLRIIKGMIETFSINEEKFIDEIYYLSLKVSFNKKKIFDLLEGQNIFPSLPIKKKIFFIPIIFDEDKNNIVMFSESYLFNNWNSNVKEYHLLEYILPAEDIEDFNIVKNNSQNLENYDFEDIFMKYNLKDYIIAIIFKNNDQIKVLSKLKFNEKIDLKNTKLKSFDLSNDDKLEEFIKNLKTIYENYWKSKNQINTSVKLSLTISIDNKENIKISKFEKILNNIDLIYDFYIFKFNNKKNFYKVVFNGTPDYFLQIMKEKNYEFDTQNLVWSLR